LDDVAAVAFGRASGGKLFEFLHGSALGGNFLAELSAGFGFAVESLGDGGWAADIAEEQDFYVKFSAVVGHAEHVGDANLTRWFGGLIVGLHASELAGAGREGASFEKARGPEPFIDADGGHGMISLF
jgi:hypothetical protein